MKKTFISLSLSLLLASPAMADKRNYDISDKPPEFKPLPNEFGITVKKAEPVIDEEQIAREKAEQEARQQLQQFYGEHNPEDHDHDHDDQEDLDHDHDDPNYHQKQIEEAKKKAAELGIEQSQERKWWQFW